MTPINDPPTFSLGPDQSVDEDAGPQTVAGWATAISPGPADEAGQALTFTVTGGDETLFAVLPAIAADGILTYTPAPQASGNARLTVNLIDDGGPPAGAVPGKGGKKQQEPVFSITVNPVNDPPVLAQIAPQTVDEGQPLTFGATATDVDGAVSLAIDGLPPGAGFADHQDGTATFTWTPGYDQTFAIAAETGYRIDDVLVDGISVGAVESYTFSGVTTDHAISASFLINTYNLTATAGIGGTITPAGVTTVTYGSSQIYTVAPGAGYAREGQLTSVGRQATVGQRQQVAAEYFPLFQGFGLPVFQSGTPGTRDVEV